MQSYNPLGMVDIAELTRPKSRGQMVDTRVVHAPAEPRPDYERMREAVYGKDPSDGSESRDGKYEKR